MGHNCSEGGIFAGSFGGYLYMTTPGNCDQSATPTCNGSEDSIFVSYDTVNEASGATSLSDGLYNTNLLAAFSTTTAALFCKNMTYAGYHDWFLPAQQELDMILSHYIEITGFFQNHRYQSSTEVDSSNAITSSIGGDVDFAWPKIKSIASGGGFVRCVRRY